MVSVAKADFSVAEAFSAGVGVIERSFNSVLVWAAVTFTTSLMPALVIFLLKGGQLSVPDGGRSLASFKGADPGVLISQFHRVVDGGFWTYIVVALAWALFWSAVLHTAIYRSVLQPEAKRNAWLRFGGAEWGLFLLLIVQVMGVALLAVFWIGFVFVMLLVGRIIGSPAGDWLVTLGATAATITALWILIRFSLAGAMTTAEGRFRFFGSWEVTKGRTWKLFWTFFLIVALGRGLEVFSVAAILVLDSFALEPLPAALILFQLLWLALVSMIIACLRTLVLAPLATAYKGLTVGG